MDEGNDPGAEKTEELAEMDRRAMALIQGLQQVRQLSDEVLARFRAGETPRGTDQPVCFIPRHQ